MKKYILSIVTLLSVSSLQAQIVTDYKIKERDGKVSVSFSTQLPKVKSNEKLTLTPVLYNGDKMKSLEPIVAMGCKRKISERRVGDAVNKDNTRYTTTVAYEPWMSEVSLRIDQKTSSCCTEKVLHSYDVVTSIPIRYDVVISKMEPIVSELTSIQKIDTEGPYLYPMSEYRAITEDFDVLRAEGALIVYFKQGSMVIDPDFENNKKSLEQIRKVLALIEVDPQVSLGKIVLAGASSPEGSLLRNKDISLKRANALKSHLGEDVNSEAGLFETINIGEDWTGLRKMVETSDMQYKQQVLDIIDNVPVRQGREKQLMGLKWGRPYNYMLAHFFPKLRSAGYIRIFYESKPSPDFEKTNQAVDEYNNGAYRDALTRLEGVQPTATTEDIRGVCYMMLGDYIKAETTLNQAVSLGSKQAADNLLQLQKLKAINK
ncbi:hypothetical protein [Bacteroides sp.]|uniref:hypothetical protein n=1 Tax=Bacteroides sp. TaxID=29523 RepID=UPI002FC5EACF